MKPSTPSPARAWLARATPRIFEPAAVALLAALLLLWLADYAVFRSRLSHGRGMGTVQVDNYLAVPLKNGKEQFDFVGSDPQPCVHALFPQSQGAPCWYLARHRDHRTSL